MREQTPPEETTTQTETEPADTELARYAARRQARESAKGGHHRRRSKLLRRVATAGAAAAVVAATASLAVPGGAATAIGTAFSGTEEPTKEERLARDIVAEAIESDHDWQGVEAMTSILPKEAQPRAANQTSAARTEIRETGPTVNADAAPIDGLDATQMANAAAIIQAGIDRGLSERAWAVALATAMQESKFYNSANPAVPESYNYDFDIEYSDHDSVGLFQQRPSMGWGSVEELMDPATSASKFYDTLEQVSGWEDMSIAGAAQAVQVSAFPDYYAQWEDLAWNLIDAQVN